jgi:phosphoribosylformylglycinamidine synthase
MYWRGKKIVDMSREFLDSNGAERFASAEIKTPDVSSFFSSTDDSVTSKRVLERLADTSMCSQKGLVQQFDSSIGAAACLMPFGGQTQLTPADCMAAKIPLVSGETSTCTFMSYAYNPKLAKLSPFHSAMYAVLESVAKIVAGGGDYKKIYFTFQEYFEKLGSDPSRWGKPLAALLGAYYAQIQLDRASIGGKDSMSGSFNDIDVPPALVSFAVSVGNSKNVISPEFKRAGHDLILIEIDRDSNYIPDFQQARISYEQIHKLIKDERVCSARSIGANGLIGSIIQSFGNNIGLEIATGFDLYTPRIGSILLEVASARSISFDKNVHYEVIGRTISDDKFVCDNCEVPIDESVKAWSFTLSDVFPEGDANACKPIFYKNTEKRLHYPKHITKPNVVIPVFPGTNGEYDSARAFEKAGAKVNIVVMRNLTKEHIEASIDELSEFINRSQILMIPGGFSAGDEPDGSAKYISAALRNPHISEAIMNLISKRDGLILGICNGFQALIKLGLVPYGEIRVMTPESPTLTYNISGKHISIMVKTRISSNISPWLADFNVGNEHIIPISHGEGRLVAPESVLEKLAANGQIATQYVENVNGSALSIEGITSPDGRIFGKMGHSERIISADTAKNIYGNKIQDIFKNGVAYFK